MSKKYRKSISGNSIPESDQIRTHIELLTLCPQKWVIVDTENGHIYGKKDNESGWVDPPLTALKDARLSLTRAIKERSKAIVITCDLDRGTCSNQYGMGYQTGCSDIGKCKHKRVNGKHERQL